MARRNRLNTTSRTGGRRISTNAQFAQDVNNRLYGGNPLPRVAQASSDNVPAAIVRETNRLGGRNALRTSPNGKLTARQARYKEIRAAFGLSQG